jgi:hypothetical protein
MSNTSILRRSRLQHYTFYDFIINKARGKSGPLFNFDVHDDVRMVNDASVEKDEVSRRLDGEFDLTLDSRTPERWLNAHGTTDSNT